MRSDVGGLEAVFRIVFAQEVEARDANLADVLRTKMERPREVFRSEAIGGRKSYLVNLGDAAFSSPAILGGAARQAGISCSSCHVNGASNPKFYIPGLSTRPGNFITTGGLFNPKANNR